MIFAITLGYWFAAIGRLIINPLAGCLLFMLLLPFTPRYFAIGIGSEGIALTAKRLLLFSFAIFFLTHSSYRSGLLAFMKDVKVLWLLIFLAFISLIGTAQHGNWYYSILYFTETIAILIVAFGIGWRLSHDEGGADKLIKYGFCYPLMVCAALVVLELIRRAPVLAGIVTIDANIATNRDFYYDHTLRDGVFRAKALFDGPLQLAEYASFVVPIAVVAKLYRVISYKMLIALLICSAIVIMGTSTRSSLLTVAVSLASVFLIYLLRNGRSMGRLFVWIGMIICVITGFTAIYLMTSAVQTDVPLYLVDNMRERSTLVRLLQYKVIPVIVSDSPIYGFGYQRHFVNLFDELISLDNYYLKILLQSGYVGLTVYVISVFAMVRVIVKNAFSVDKRNEMLGMIGIATILNHVLYKIFSSSDVQNIYIVLIFAFIVSRSHLLSSER